MLCPAHPQRPSLLAAEHRLRFQVQLTDVEVAEWEDAVLECQVPLETIPTAWYLEDRELQPSHKYVMEEQGVVRRLTIRDARTDDDGIYLCQMKDKGRSIAEVSVRGEGQVSGSVALPSSPPPCQARRCISPLCQSSYSLAMVPAAAPPQPHPPPLSHPREPTLLLSIPPWPSCISSHRGDREAAAAEAGRDGGGERGFLCGDAGGGGGDLLEPGRAAAARISPHRAEELWQDAPPGAGACHPPGCGHHLLRCWGVTDVLPAPGQV